MIRIARGDAPSVFWEQEVEDWRRKAETFFNQPSAVRSQQRYKFSGLTRISAVQDALIDLFHSKCAYCEELLEPYTNFSIDRFRSPNGVVNMDGTFDPDHYWWLAYEWFNVYPACRVCNSMKGNRFPIAGARATIGADQADLAGEQALLLDPCVDQPEQHLVFGRDGSVACDTPQGHATIDVLGLNRSDLVAARHAAYIEAEMRLAAFVGQLDTTKVSLQQLTALLDELFDARQAYAALRRQVLMQWLNQSNTIHRIGVQLGGQALDALLNTLPSSDTVNVLWSLSRPTIKKLQLQLPVTLSVSDSLRQWWSRFLSASYPPRPQLPKNEQVLVESSTAKTRHHEQTIVKQFQAEQASAETYSIEDDAGKEQYYRKRRLIERIELRNFKGIRDLSIGFSTADHSPTPWLLLLGENGTGKSSILQAITLALMGEKHRAELFDGGLLDPARILRYGTRSGYVKVHWDGIPEPTELHFRKGLSGFEGSATELQIPLLAYGATRLLPRPMTVASTQRGLARTRNLFDPFAPLHDAQVWLSDLPRAQFDRAARGLKDLMLLDDEDRLFKARKGGVKARTQGGSVLLRDLSDGYQTVLALAVDIMSVMQQRWETIEIAEGIVLVDELDAHLHPRWKMQIVKRLRQTFPRIQFIVTSHDPLCLRGFSQQEVVVMRRDMQERIIALTDLPDPSALRVDQILTSEYFGLNSTVDPELERLFNEYYELLALRQPTQQQSARIAELKGQLEQRELLGTTRRERLMIEAADKFVAQQAQEPDAARRSEMHNEARDVIVELWDTLDLSQVKR